MSYRGIADFGTDNPGRLRSELQRLNRAVGEAFDEVERGRQKALTVRQVKAHTTAADGEMLVVTGAVSVTLPSAQAGARVIVVKADSAVTTVTVLPANERLFVNGSQSDSITTQQLREYVSDGANWWRA